MALLLLPLDEVVTWDDLSGSASATGLLVQLSMLFDCLKLALGVLDVPVRTSLSSGEKRILTFDISKRVEAALENSLGLREIALGSCYAGAPPPPFEREQESPRPAL